MTRVSSTSFPFFDRIEYKNLSNAKMKVMQYEKTADFANFNQVARKFIFRFYAYF